MTNVLPPAPISWSGAQIESMHPYKWKTDLRRISLPEAVREKYHVKQAVFAWELSPDLDRAEHAGLLSSGRAVFADILQTNQWRRPVVFSLGSHPSVWENLEPYIQLRGFVQELVPAECPSHINAQVTEDLLLDERNFRHLPTLAGSDMPRASAMVKNYRAAFLRLASHQVQNGESEAARKTLAAMKANVPSDVLAVTEAYTAVIQSLEKALEPHE